MKTELTEFLLRLTFHRHERQQDEPTSQCYIVEDYPLNSTQILQHIYSTLNSEKNYRDIRSHKLSLSSEDTNPQSPVKCNCKKSKCLKLYCECFSRGSFCKDCNCDCCQNTQEHVEVRARAIDEMLVKAALPFGYKTSSMKGCNCKKTGCQKKYCQCLNSGTICNQFCKCTNCENCS